LKPGFQRKREMLFDLQRRAQSRDQEVDRRRFEDIVDADATGRAGIDQLLDAVLAKNSTVRFIVPPCKGAVLGSTARTAPTQRDLHIRSIRQHGRMNWQKTSGYNRYNPQKSCPFPIASRERNRKS
jgi:hypothetical protein